MATTWNDISESLHSDSSSRHSVRLSRSLLPSAVLLGACILTVVGTVQGQDTPDFFRQNCTQCHTIGGGRLTGPDLKDVTQRQTREWLIKFMLDPKGVKDSGDAYAEKIFEESRDVPMPPLAGASAEEKNDRAERLLDLIEAESMLEESQFKGLQISNEPFTDADRELGRQLFTGKVRLEAGGASCISCHSMHDTPALGGGRLGPDLTNIFERLKDRKSLSAWLKGPATETMLPIFKDRPMTADEIHALTAYFEASSGDSPSEPAANRIAFLLIGLVGAAIMIFAFDAIWKRRFHSVRRSLVEANTNRGKA